MFGYLAKNSWTHRSTDATNRRSRKNQSSHSPETRKNDPLVKKKKGKTMVFRLDYFNETEENKNAEFAEVRVAWIILYSSVGALSRRGGSSLSVPGRDREDFPLECCGEGVRANILEYFNGATPGWFRRGEARTGLTIVEPPASSLRALCRLGSRRGRRGRGRGRGRLRKPLEKGFRVRGSELMEDGDRTKPAIWWACENYPAISVKFPAGRVLW